MTRPVCLIIMDGLAYGVDCGTLSTNAIQAAKTPVLDRLWHDYPHTLLRASGPAVGLPEGQMGNSEVGHLNMGAGRVVYQELTRINRAIADGSFFENSVLREACAFARKHTGRLHLMGLLSDGGVHSENAHLYALLHLAHDEGVPEVLVHCFMDGRDTLPESGAGYIAELQAQMQEIGIGRIASISGRYYAMDRDKRWERVQRTYDALIQGEGRWAPTAECAIEASYAAGVTDEFVEPTLIGSGGQVGDGDSLVFFNFRPDRARELSYACTQPGFDGFKRKSVPLLHFVCLTEYDPALALPVAFPKEYPVDVLADVVAQAGLRQLHIAETEKYAHVTFFFNGGSEPPKTGEERILIPSPKVATYDLQPEMSAPEVGDALVAAIERDAADFYVVNFANGDMVGHTGKFPAVIRAVETVDTQVGRVVEAIRACGGVALVTADHGNAEQMCAGDKGDPYTAHTCNPVPLIVAGTQELELRAAKLSDIAPLVLELLGLAVPLSWTA